MGHEERQRELERLAFGETVPREQRASALRELAALSRSGVDASQPQPSQPQSAQPSQHQPSQPSQVGGDPDHDPGSETRAVEGIDGATPGARRRLLVGGVLVATLLVGGAAGAAVEGTFRPVSRFSLQATEPTPSSTADSAATSRLAAGDPAVVVPTGDPDQAADALLSRSATPADAYPFADGDADEYIDSSTRVVVTTASQNRVWIAKSRSPSDGYCLLTTTARPRPSGSPARLRARAPTPSRPRASCWQPATSRRPGAEVPSRSASRTDPASYATRGGAAQHW